LNYDSKWKVIFHKSCQNYLKVHLIYSFELFIYFYEKGLNPRFEKIEIIISNLKFLIIYFYENYVWVQDFFFKKHDRDDNIK